MVNRGDDGEPTILNVVFLKNTIQLTAHCVHDVGIHHHPSIFRSDNEFLFFCPLGLLLRNMVIIDHSSQGDITLTSSSFDIFKGRKGVRPSDNTRQHR